MEDCGQTRKWWISQRHPSKILSGSPMLEPEFKMALNIWMEHASVIATTPHTKPRPLNEAVVPSKTSCELAFAMPSARSEAMQTEVKGCGLNEAVVPSKISCELAFANRFVQGPWLGVWRRCNYRRMFRRDVQRHSINF